MLASALAVVAASPMAARRYTVTASGLVVLLPGLTLTTALAELALRHRLGSHALLGGLCDAPPPGLGVAVGRRVGDLLPATVRWLSGMSSPMPP